MPHRDDCRKRYKENDWRLKHAQYLIQWENRQRCDPEDGPYWRARPNNEYIRWYCASMRTKVKPSWSNVPIENAPSDSSNDIADVYDTVLAGGHEASEDSKGNQSEDDDPTYGICTSYADAPPASFTGPHRCWHRQCATHASKEGASPTRSF
uniref:Uncharacterized protein n=1 Tax=Setaria viridis TaxID=4556 RepID=A0A4U6VCD2_SETVI|nr:hypothetical protein SEVIR_4G131800v2 [Setaria viridis]